MQPRKSDPDRNYTIKTIDKALKLLELLAEYEDGASLTQLALQADLSNNGAFRILQTMNTKGLVEQTASGTYRLGFCSVTLAQKLLKNMSVVNYAHPILENLARTHEEAVYLTVLKDDEVLFLDMVDCCQQIKAEPLLGQLVPFFSNAAGKVMKSFDSQDLLKRMLKRKNNSRDLEKLNQELNEIRAKGVAVESGGLGDGIISVAVAIRDYTGKVVGAITFIVPSFRMLAGRLEKEIIPSLKEGAEILSGKFGYCPA